MRQYSPIWNQIKKAGTATIIAPIAFHRRIIQAVRKEKWRDEGWRLLTSEAEIRYELQDKVEIHEGSDSGSVTFTLVDITGITIKDL